MRGIEVWLIAISLAMDCFAVSIASGIILKRIYWKVILRTAFAFGFFQMMMTLIGWFFAYSFNHLIEGIDHWIAFGLLATIGIRMIIESFKKKEERSFNPVKWKVTILMAVATSIDAVAVGISYSLVESKTAGQNILSASIIIGFVAFIISLIGFVGSICFGKSFAKKLCAEMWGGIILIGIGTKILIEHLLL